MTQYDIYTDPMWSVLGSYPVEIRHPTRWDRVVLWLRRAVNRV